MDSAVWVAALTGGTAVLAGWVTTLGNVRAARVQAEESARAQQVGRVRELRREAYLELMRRSHEMSELYWKVGEVRYEPTDPASFLTRIQQLRVEAREAYDPLMHSVRVIALEGPDRLAELAKAVLAAAALTNGSLAEVHRSGAGAFARFDAAMEAYGLSLAAFVEAARDAMNEPL
ncbi:hypothetical protein IAG44_27640 [Streptomyces roseirectus]|uniref:Uncharacterized protein n=1 Tax=Streptomyces roseirectus TaxID=2768066 RepID=A0A7H0IJ66_9ACTN|nr:hypothetical protein [Streptomyces roseirectus]QNP72832.1 hypothetical protein IAG44_27640 [Streptomyces roseirectus]